MLAPLSRYIALGIVFMGASTFALYGCGCVKFNPAVKPKENELSLIDQRFSKKKIALVLGGGGAKGMAHIGVLEELNQNGVVPDVIIGCSAGAIVGALYAADPDINTLKMHVMHGKSSDVAALSTDHWPYSVYSVNPLARYLRKNLVNTDFAELQIPLIIVATDLQHGHLHAFHTGDVVPAVIASASYPGAFAPIQIDDRYYVDCGIADPVPTRIAKELGFETIIAVNIAEGLPETSPNHVLGLLKRSTEIGYINLIKHSLSYADVVIDFDFKNVDLFDDRQNLYLYEQGKIRTKAKMAEIIKLTSAK